MEIIRDKNGGISFYFSEEERESSAARIWIALIDWSKIEDYLFDTLGLDYFEHIASEEDWVKEWEECPDDKVDIIQEFVPDFEGEDFTEELFNRFNEALRAAYRQV